MEKRQFRIGELAQNLQVERFVIRFWEKEFAIAPHRSPGGQRFYTEDDLHLFSHIKTLLYDHGFTIAGAKQQIDNHQNPPTFIASHKDPSQTKAQKKPNNLKNQVIQLLHLKTELEKLQNLL